MCGIYPQEYFAEEIPFANTLSESAFPFFLFFALVILLLYFVCWVFSKNNKVGWLIFALVFFAIDTVILLLFLGIQADSILNIVFHGWVIVSLIMGIRASYKLKKLPIADAAGPETADAAETQEALSNSEVIRTADKNVKAKILLETNALDHSITYRRIKRVNELVIDGNVYDEFNALVEVAHSLNAKIDGHLIEAGYDGKFHSYVKVDGQMVAKKLRLI